MSAPNNPFEQIIIPVQTPSIWPPAPIYWFITGIILTIIVCSVFFIKHYLNKQKKVKQALDSLQNLQQSNLSFAQLNQLLKGLALQYYPRSEVASLAGKDWFLFIQQHNSQHCVIFGSQEQFCQRLYQQHSLCTELDLATAKQWLSEFPMQMKVLQKKILANNILVGTKNV